jgi:hypothetical protein
MIPIDRSEVGAAPPCLPHYNLFNPDRRDAIL